GQMLEETPNVDPFHDPFGLLPINPAAAIWDAYGMCTQQACGMIFTAVCGKMAGTSINSGKSASTDASATTEHAAYASVAAGAIGTVSVGCPAGTLSSAGGYVAQSPNATKLLALTPTTPGTPYETRVDGTYEGP